MVTKQQVYGDILFNAFISPLDIIVDGLGEPMSDNHYAVDWRYLTINNYLQTSLTTGAAWEFKSIKLALSKLLSVGKRNAYRFSAASVPVRPPNPRP